MSKSSTEGAQREQATHRAGSIEAGARQLHSEPPKCMHACTQRIAVVQQQLRVQAYTTRLHKGKHYAHLHQFIKFYVHQLPSYFSSLITRFIIA